MMMMEIMVTTAKCTYIHLKKNTGSFCLSEETGKYKEVNQLHNLTGNSLSE